MITVNVNEGKFDPITIPERKYEYSSNPDKTYNKSCFYDFAAQKGVIFSCFSDEEGSAFAKSL